MENNKICTALKKTQKIYMIVCLIDKEEKKIRTKNIFLIPDRDTYNYLYFSYHHIHERGTSIDHSPV